MYLYFFNDEIIGGDVGPQFLDYSAENWVAHFREAHFETEARMVPLVLTICNPDSRSSAAWWRRYLLVQRKMVPNPRNTLALASSLGHLAVSGFLLSEGADPNSTDVVDQTTPLLWAAAYGQEAIVKQLLTHGAVVDAKDNDGRTPLHWAAMNGCEAVVKQLITHGANVDAKDNGGRTLIYLWRTSYLLGYK
jgi:ankyrin repeat protein